MEIKGVVREIEGDNGAIKVKQRDNFERESGDIDMSTEIQVRDNAQGKKDNIYSETVVIDLKRRRLEEETCGDNNGLSNIDDKDDNSVTGPKNLQLAGPGIQARPSP